jgi:predicted RNA-binding Zn-ribbon protein involved in translation (DUF1610 family)
MSSTPELDIAATMEAEQREAMERSWEGEKRHPCPDCGAPPSRIRLTGGSPDDAGGTGPVVGYTAEQIDRGWFRGAIPATGAISARVCPDCGRVVLFAVPRKS